jgi:hypothetical protein
MAAFMSVWQIHEVGEGHALHVKVDVNAVKQGAADTLLVAVDHACGTRTILHGVAVVATRAGIHRANKQRGFTIGPRLHSRYLCTFLSAASGKIT